MDLRTAVRDVLGVHDQGGAEWTSRCFSPDHNDSKPSASVNVEKGVWVCYSCGRGGRVEDLLSGVRISDPSSDDNLDRAESDLAALDAAPRIYPESWLYLFDYPGGPHPYWTGRGFTASTVDTHRLGYDYEHESVTYPLRDEGGRIYGVVRRHLEDRRPKYLYPKGVKTHDFLYGYHLWPEERTDVVLVEGALDAIALWQVGIPALAIYGSKISERQTKLIRRLWPAQVICAFDKDGAGDSATNSVMDALSDYQVIEAHWSPEEAKDVAELSAERRVEVIREAC